MEKLTKQETVSLFKNLAEQHGVLDQSKSGGGHERFRLGKVGKNKPLFLACSRVGWMCVYVDKTESALLNQNGFVCEAIPSNDEPYDYRAHISASDFDKFLDMVQKYLGRYSFN